MIDLTWLAGPLGLVGLAVALVLWRASRAGGARDAATTAGMKGRARTILKQFPVIAAVAVVLGGLLWPSVAFSTAIAFLCGALLTLAASAFAAKSVEDVRLDLATATLKADGEGSRRALGVSLAMGLAVASTGLLGLGLLYFTLVHAPAAFLQSELVDFGNITGGFALGASVVALLIAIVGGTFTTATAAYGTSVLQPTASGSDRRQLELSELGTTGATAGSAGDLLQSYLCASVAAIVIAGTGSIYSSQRVEAIALPILVGAVGLIASIGVVGAARVLRSANPAAAFRTLGLVATAAFLILAYLVVAALGMEGQDPFTGREYLLSGPFWAILTGSLAGVLIGFATEFYTSWRPARRVAESSGRGLGPTILWAVALGMESVLIPGLLIAAAVIVSYYFAGAYGIAIGAVGLLATVGITAAAASFGPLVARSAVPGERSARGEDRSVAVGLAAIGGSAEAIARGVSVAAAAMTSLALLTGYVHATGLWGIGIDLQSPLVLAGLVTGSALPVLTAAVLLAGGRRTSARLVEASPDAAPGGTAHTDADIVAARARLPRKLIIPTLVAIALPPLFGYAFGVASVAGLIAGGVLSSLVTALFLANSGSTLVNTSTFIAANATAAEVHGIGHVSADFGRALRDGCVPGITVMVKLIGVLSIVLVPWFARIL